MTVKVTIPEPDINTAMKMPTFKMPAAYQLYNSLMGALGKPFGLMGGPYHMFSSRTFDSMDTPYGRIKVKPK